MVELLSPKVTGQWKLELGNNFEHLCEVVKLYLKLLHTASGQILGVVELISISNRVGDICLSRLAARSASPRMCGLISTDVRFRVVKRPSKRRWMNARNR